MKNDLEIEKKIKAVLSNGPSATWVVAAKIGMKGKTPAVRKILQYMQQRGLVRRHVYSCATNIVWQLTDSTQNPLRK